MRGLALAGLSLLVLLLAPVATAAPTISVLDAPEVVVANPPENMTQDNFNPDYTFSSAVRVTNDDDPSQVNTEAIVYTDPSVQGCPQDKRAFAVSFVVKTRDLEPGGQVEIGGSDDPTVGGNAYWPMALAQEYRDPKAGESVEFGGDEHTFCTNVRVTGKDASCDKPDDQTCIVATDSFRSYVRAENAAPEITEFSVPENPEPGQTVLFEADAEDDDTQPRPDSLTFTWTAGSFEDTGRTVQHAFPINDTYTVTLSVTDGFDTVKRSVEVAVGDAGQEGPIGGDDRIPLPPALALVGLVAAALARRR